MRATFIRRSSSGRVQVVRKPSYSAKSKESSVEEVVKTNEHFVALVHRAVACLVTNDILRKELAVELADLVKVADNPVIDGQGEDLSVRYATILWIQSTVTDALRASHDPFSNSFASFAIIHDHSRFAVQLSEDASSLSLVINPLDLGASRFLQDHLGMTDKSSLVLRLLPLQ